MSERIDETAANDSLPRPSQNLQPAWPEFEGARVPPERFAENRPTKLLDEGALPFVRWNRKLRRGYRSRRRAIKPSVPTRFHRERRLAFIDPAFDQPRCFENDARHASASVQRSRPVYFANSDNDGARFFRLFASWRETRGACEM